MMTMMATFLGEIDRHARECYDEGAGLTLRPLDPEADAPLLQLVRDGLRALLVHAGPQRGAGARLLRRAVRQWPCPGLARFAPGPPAFLVGATTRPRPNWRALPRASGRHRHAHLHRSATQRIPGFSRDVFALVMRFLFDRLNAARVVVEPDANNAKIHALNLAMGFVYAGQARFRENRQPRLLHPRPIRAGPTGSTL